MGRLLRLTGLAAKEGLGAGGARDPVEDLGPVGLLERLGERWYRLAWASARPPLAGIMQAVGEVA